jgi:excisionase family DNA binding protein
VASRAGVCIETIYREIRTGKLVASKVRGQWRISEEELVRYLRASEKPLRLYARATERGDI